MRAVELTAQIDHQHLLQAVVPLDIAPGQVRVLVLLPDSNGLGLEQKSSVADPTKPDWAALAALINECQVDTGIEDLAHQHDHYLHGSLRHR